MNSSWFNSSLTIALRLEMAVHSRPKCLLLLPLPWSNLILPNHARTNRQLYVLYSLCFVVPMDNFRSRRHTRLSVLLWSAQDSIGTMNLAAIILILRLMLSGVPTLLSILMQSPSAIRAGLFASWLIELYSLDLPPVLMSFR